MEDSYSYFLFDYLFIGDKLTELCNSIANNSYAICFISLTNSSIGEASS